MLYTSISGSKDLPRNDIKVIEYDRFKDDRMNAKIAKIMPHLFMDCEYSVWVDGNIYPLMEESEYIKLLGDKDIAVFRHPERQNVYDEADFCKLKGKDIGDRIDPQIARYKKEGFDGSGLVACGFIVRRHTKEIKRLCEQWWAEICTCSVRDQISFPYVFKGKYNIIDRNIWDNEFIIMKPHIK